MNALHERLFRLSAQALTNNELLEVLLGTDALREQDIRTIAKTPFDDWLSDERLTHEQSARLLTGIELSRRLLEASPPESQRILNPTDAFHYIRRHLLHLPREEMHVLCLANNNLLLEHRRVAQGSATRCDVDPREVFFPALKCRASSIILAHNHPSGDPQPSTSDLEMTEQIRTAASALCIRLLDHIVVGDGVFCSMRQEGLIESLTEFGTEVMQP